MRARALRKIAWIAAAGLALAACDHPRQKVADTRVAYYADDSGDEEEDVAVESHRFLTKAEADYEVAVAQAEADYGVAIEKCEARSGPSRERCKEDAQQIFDAHRAQAEQDREAAQNSQT